MKSITKNIKSINTEACVKCGNCMEVCPVGAVIKRKIARHIRRRVFDKKHRDRIS